MKRTLSPLEKSRQILRQIELEEKRIRNINKNSENIVPYSSESNDPESSEGISIEGPGDKKKIIEEVVETKASCPLLSFNQKSIIQGIIFSEALGKPVARRRGRW